MKRFEVGKLYDVNGGGVIRITKRTPCYATYAVALQPEVPSRELVRRGRKMVCDLNLFGNGESFWIPCTNPHSSMLVMAGSVVEDDVEY